MRKPTKWAAGIAAVCLAAGLSALPAFAVHDDGDFELDGNAIDQSKATRLLRR